MKRIRQAIAVLSLGAASGLAAAAPADPAQYSFADLYRLTVSGAPLPAAQPDRGEAVIRPISTEQPQPARYAFSIATPTAQAGGNAFSGGYTFSIGALPEPGRWLLF